MKRRKVYACSCGHQISPTAGTIFHKSSTSLFKWFYAIYLTSQAKNGISAKELERQLGISYHTALRMTRQIKQLMIQEDDILNGTIEIDETYIGGKNKNRHYHKRIKGSGGRAHDKAAIIGFLQRKGKVVALNVDDVSRLTVYPLIREHISMESQIMTDEFSVYQRLTSLGYEHKTINHNAHQYVDGDIYTNTLEGFWSQLKRSIDGTYHSVSRKYLQSYVDEFVFRYNHRNSEESLFEILLKKI